ncbi:hypothetical protein Fmac_023911 [Flemingia macrophylla]|uniref:Myb-related protein 123 n=1 Tax=Flemingia macrophylla TaxID=520843 RepID=A0ABD1LMU9_9FABA
MGRKGNCENEVMNRGAWSAEESKILIDYVQLHGEGNWSELSKRAGLKRSGKSSRLRWLNYLKPDIKRGNISSDEEDLIIRLHNLLGNRWSLIAGRLPGRTDNEIKNYWNGHLRKKIDQKHNHRKSRVEFEFEFEYKGRTINSLDVNNSTKSSPLHAANDAMNNVVITGHNPNPFASTPQDGHDNFSTGLDICDQLIVPHEDFHFNNECASVEIPKNLIDEAFGFDEYSIGQAWHESWKLVDFFPTDQVANYFSL